MIQADRQTDFYAPNIFVYCHIICAIVIIECNLCCPLWDLDWKKYPLSESDVFVCWAISMKRLKTEQFLFDGHFHWGT